MENSMKNKRLSLLTWIGGFILAVLYACSGGGSSSYEAPTSAPTSPVTVQVTVLDARTLLPIETVAPSQVTLWLYGDGASLVVDSDGVSSYDNLNKSAGPFKSTDGIFAFNLKADATSASDASLRIVVSAPNYVGSSTEVGLQSSDFNSTSGETKVIGASVMLISQTNPPDSVTAGSESLTIAGGVTGGAVTATTTAASGSVGGANINLGKAEAFIPPSTTVYADASRTQVLPAGPATLNVTYNNNQTNTSLATFPGGFLTMEDPDGNSIPSPGTFISGGFASVELTSTASDGTVVKAKAFDKPIKLTITIPKRTINPLTGLAVKAGDVIPIWSYDSSTGVWSAQKLRNGTPITGTLGEMDDSGDTYPVTFETDHLSYFNLDWFAYRSRAGKPWVPQCDRTAMKIKGAQGKAIYIQLSLPGGGWMHRMQLFPKSSAPAIETLNLARAPQGLPVRIDAYLGTYRSESKKVGSLEVRDLCAGVDLDITQGVSDVLERVQYADFQIRTRKVCSQDATVTSNLAGVSIFVFSPGSGWVSAVSQSSGLATLKSLEVGKQYFLYVDRRAGLYRAPWLMSESSTAKPGYRTFIVNSNNAEKTIDFPVTCSQPKPTGTGSGTGASGSPTGTGS